MRSTSRRLQIGIISIWLIICFCISRYLPETKAQVIPITSGGAATSVSSAAFPLLAPNGTQAAPSYSFSGATSTGIYSNGSPDLGFSIASTTYLRLLSSTATFNSATNVGWASGDPQATSIDTGLKRITTKVVGATDGGAGAGWIQNTAARARLASDYTNATTTFSNTALSYTLVSGRIYNFKTILFISDSLAADGAKLDFNGGTATMTNFRAHCTLFDTALLASQQGTALTSVFNAGTVTGSGYFECYGSAEPSGNGTIILRLAQNAHTTGTLTAFRGSYGWFEDMP